MAGYELLYLYYTICPYLLSNYWNPSVYLHVLLHNTMHKCRAFVNSPFSHVPAAVPPDLGIIPTEIRGKSPCLKTAEALEE